MEGELSLTTQETQDRQAGCGTYLSRLHYRRTLPLLGARLWPIAKARLHGLLMSDVKVKLMVCVL